MIPALLKGGKAFPKSRHREIISQLEYPPVVSPHPQHSQRLVATVVQARRANEIIAKTPTGPRPIDIAQTFVDRFYAKEPALISQMPPPAAPNPLIAKFFENILTPNGDVVPWCAAFANFCIHRSGRNGSGSASSQSFLEPAFRKTNSPEEGDLAIFTCFNPSTGQNLRLGHVAFFKERIDETHIKVVGGNQSAEDHASIISETVMLTADRSLRRHLPNGDYAPVIMRLSAYVSLS
ncbi:CHAP domain-containing protein [Rhizobium tubonense]|nr:CHAP domain-containing protein [Rhizobium tubonense]